MKTVYFVRHGETNANILRQWQGANDELSPAGLGQADRVAYRIATLSIDRALTSDMKRAVQTADAISQRTKLVFEKSPLFVEARVPSSTVGKKFVEEDGNVCFEYIKARAVNGIDPEFRYSDEETLTELHHRAQQALAHIDTIDSQNILVITHGTFMRVLINTVLHHGVTDDPYIIFSAGRNMLVENTGISVIQKKDPNNPWSVFTFNDHAHFAE